MAGKEEQTEFYETHPGHASGLSKYQKRLYCVEDTELELSGDSNSERGRTIKLAFEMCDQTKLANDALC